MELLLRRLGVGVVAALDIIVLRRQTQIILRRPGRCPLLVTRWDGRLNPVETGLEIRSEQLVLMVPRARRSANYSVRSLFATCFTFFSGYFERLLVSQSRIKDTLQSRGRMRKRERKREMRVLE